MDTTKIKQGQTLWVKTIGNLARGGTSRHFSVIVTSVGKKYFTLDKCIRCKFEIASLQEATEYSSNFKVYFSEQEILDEKEAEILAEKIRNIIGAYGKSTLSIAQLRAIYKIAENK